MYGSDINAARTMIDALSDVSSNALVPMADNLSQATPGKLFQDGMINVSALQAVADSLSSSSKVFKSANEKVQGIGDTHISQVTELVDKAKDGFATLNGAVDAAEKVAQLPYVRHEQRRDSCLRRLWRFAGPDFGHRRSDVDWRVCSPHWTQRG